jgi:signal peptidase II
MTERTPAIVLTYVVALLVIGLDQSSKALITATLGSGQPPITLVPNVLYLVYGLNTGMAFGLLVDASLILTVVAVVAAIGLAVFNQRLAGTALLPRLTLGLLLGGAIGNLIDRLRLGAVVDFIYFAPINFPAFNVADSALTIGVLLAAWQLSRASGEPSHEAPANDRATG